MLVSLAAARRDSIADDRGSSTAPIYWRQTKFLVPFEIQGGGDVAKVELYVSDDLGKSWKLAGQATPKEAKFLFNAPRDGEYWFDVTTVDRKGKVRGDATHAAGLKVVVDTAPPKLVLEARRGTAGELVAKWKAEDPYLDANSLVIEYQTEANGTWQRLAISGVDDQPRNLYSSESTWWLGIGEGPVTLRARIMDRAENPIVAQAIARPGDAGALAATAKEPRDRTAGESANSSGANSAAAAPSPRTIVTTADNESRAADGSMKGPSLPRQWPADKSMNIYPTRMRRSSGDAASADDARDRVAGGAWQHEDARGASGKRASEEQDAPESASAGTTRANAQRTAATVVSSRNDSSARRGRSALDFSLVPSGERARMVNSRTFELEYEVEAVGASGIAKVELWGTRNGGQDWSLMAVDEDNRSPLDVTIDQEGIYGFAIVVESGSGVGSPPPRPGDLPEVWVGVDLTPPLATITGTELSDEGAELTIRWRADDDLLESRPVSLSYSEQPNGPWKPIASGLENSGSYRWRLDNRLPDQIFVRLEVVDEAQNMTTNVTPRPISLDRQRPTARFRAVRPVGR